ncbi:MAG: site-specific integrase [bacterium]
MSYLFSPVIQRSASPFVCQFDCIERSGSESREREGKRKAVKAGKLDTAPLHSTEQIHCHRLRHTFATEMARAGMPVPALMKLLGHRTPKMTMRYVEVAQVDVRKAYDEAVVQLRALQNIRLKDRFDH